MTKTIRMRAHIGSDGMLDIKFPAGMTDTDVGVTVILQIDHTDSPSQNQEQWQKSIKEMAGSIPDPTFIRHAQGEYEKRDELP